ncbi:SOSS complex subunit C-like [Anneissia japonica]|uniref:SOSS complex subunit C-like n=1 Tax=Anneissia japonica TaxID=1529436 RepID=UPI0014259E53|nr:SOSS complex subunit C-like [Anneissia japonica]
MSNSGASGGQEQQNLTILENLRMKKMRMMMQGPSNSASGSSGSSGTSNQSKIGYPGRSSVSRDPSEAHHSAMQQKQALQHAQSNSFAYYVTQDSSFGNLILPVIPRLPAE